MLNLISETIVLWAVVIIFAIVVGGFMILGSKLLPAIGRYISNFIKWQRFRKKDIFEDFDDLYED